MRSELASELILWISLVYHVLEQRELIIDLLNGIVEGFNDEI